MRLPITTPGSARTCAETGPAASNVATRLMPILRIVTPGSGTLPGHDGVGQTLPQPLRRYVALLEGFPRRSSGSAVERLCVSRSSTANTAIVITANTILEDPVGRSRVAGELDAVLGLQPTEERIHQDRAGERERDRHDC